MTFPLAFRMNRVRLSVASLLAVLIGPACAGRIQPGLGVPAPAGTVVPATPLVPGHRRLVFQWEYRDTERTARGEGAARMAGPDSVRLDLFLAGSHAAAAILIGDDLRTPPVGADLLDRFIPPAPLLWAAFGRVALPVTADTTISIDGPLTRVAFGRPVMWRMAFRGDSLVRMERVEGRRVLEWVERDLDGRIRYRHERHRRSLTLTITRIDNDMEFDAATWRLPF